MNNRVNRSSGTIWSFTGSQTRISSKLLCGSNRKLDGMDRSANQAPKTAVKVLDSDGKDVTPLSLCQAEPGITVSIPGRFFLDEIFSNSGSDHLKSTSSSSLMDSSQLSSQTTRASQTKETEESVPEMDIQINLPPPYSYSVLHKRGNVKQHVTEEMLDEVVDIYLSETDTISLLDIPNTVVSEDANDAEAIKESNIHYAELCKNRGDNDKYVVQSVQTISGAPKEKRIQSDNIVMVDKGATATVWDIYDSFCEQNKNPETERPEYQESTLSTIKGQERRGEISSSSSGTVGTGSTISSLLETDICGNGFSTEPDPQQIMLSESFKHSLLVMERSIVGNIFQPKLAAYRQLPILEDPDSTAKPAAEEQSQESEESPYLEHLWAFRCEFTGRCNIRSMVWNKENPDILAVSYGGCNPNDQKEGLICCWSLKNPTWPERVFRCHSCVTSLDFSANNPSQLGVGMYDGSIAIYNIQTQSDKACIADSSTCSKKHLHPVWQVRWIKQEMRLSGEDSVEALVSVSADGRITKWLLGSNGLDCIDLIKLKGIKKSNKNRATNKKTECVLSAITSGLCLDFHPTDFSIYLVGTLDGLIHKCSFSNSEHFLDTYQKHFCPVNHIEWSPFSSDVFLSCSSDWTIQLWKQDSSTPVMSFTSGQKAVHAVRWSPNCSTVFAAINGQQVEIWDLNSSIAYPTIVYQAKPGVRATSLVFARGADCIFVGDSVGEVTVYELKNLSVGEGKQTETLDEIIHSVVSRKL